MTPRAQTLAGKLRKLPLWLAWRGIPLTPFAAQMMVNGGRIARLRDRHAGRRCFVIGNGPSLNVADLDRLRGEIAIASNKIYLAFEKTDWRPTYLTVIDEVLAANARAALRAQRLEKIYSWEAAVELRPDWGATVVRTLPHPRDANGAETPGFSDDLTRGVHGGFSVLYLSLQAAAFMGMREIYMLGVDFSFQLAPETGEVKPFAGRVLQSAGESNHFHPGYRAAGERWTYPNLEGQRRAFALAREWFESRGGCLVNVSRKTELDVLERRELESVLMKRGDVG
jgi:hypothetical protein